MLVLQNQMNCTVDQNWVELNRNWLLAAAMEAAEAIGHHGWKWWKKQTPDMEQLQMELIDIWHFALSNSIVEHGGLSDNLIEQISLSTDLLNTDPTNPPQLLGLLQMLLQCTSAGSFPIGLFFLCCKEAGLSQESLYKQYIGKNILNIFRQQNGYKDGSYIKIWDGQEDNVHLVKIINTLDVNDPRFADNLMDALVTTYTHLN